MLRFFLITLWFFQVISFSAQPQPSARFTFNNLKDYDEVSGRKPKFVNVTPTKDRFGNENCAVFISGSRYSYLNLGTYKALKPDAGTISMWFFIQGEANSGRGVIYNPLILTKYTQLNDFYESYGIYYFLESNKICCVTAKDSTCQTNLSTSEAIKLNEWLHVAISYDTNAMALYLNGKLESRVPTNFQMKFLDGDSVMVGHTANEKNLRFLFGGVDDIEFYNKVLSEKDILALYNAPNPNRATVILKWMMLMAGCVVVLLLAYFYAKYRVRIAIKIENERSEQVNKSLENELRVHRAMMNPHFIFNTLNGLQDLILKDAVEEANDYLIKFSQLLRKTLESNMSDSIPLELEIDLLKRYIEMENIRFKKNFIYSIEIDPGVNTLIKIPIMMLQPFVENAIWHGLNNKEGDKVIKIRFELCPEKYLKVSIEDNGIGMREKKNSVGKSSLATKFIKQRLDLINKIHNMDCGLTINDTGQGALVVIILPFY